MEHCVLKRQHFTKGHRLLINIYSALLYETLIIKIGSRGLWLLLSIFNNKSILFRSKFCGGGLLPFLLFLRRFAFFGTTVIPSEFSRQNV